MLLFPTPIPRNFQFFSRLPSKFMMKILGTRNITSKGVWLSVNINGHKLNVLSQTELPPGSYSVKKQGLLELKLESFDLKSETLRESTINKPTKSVEFGETAPSNNYNSAIELLTDLSLHQAFLLAFFTETENSFILAGKKSIRFSLKKPISLSGAFFPTHNHWDLLLERDTATKIDEIDLIQMRDLLKEFGIKSIKWTTSQHLDMISNDIDYLI